MTRKVFKYEQPVDGLIRYEIPLFSKIIHIGSQRSNHITIWVLVDPDESRTEKVTFRVFGTGHPISLPIGDHVATVMDGQFVWHLFDPK